MRQVWREEYGGHQHRHHQFIPPILTRQTEAGTTTMAVTRTVRTSPIRPPPSSSLGQRKRQSVLQKRRLMVGTAVCLSEQLCVQQHRRRQASLDSRLARRCPRFGRVPADNVLLRQRAASASAAAAQGVVARLASTERSGSTVDCHDIAAVGRELSAAKSKRK
jgi:hypothetical protein